MWHDFVLFFFWVQLCLVCNLVVVSTSAMDCLGRFVSKMTCYVSSGTLNTTN